MKPYLPFADSRPDAVGGYADKEVGHRLQVDFPEELLLRVPEEKRGAAITCIAEDPRPSYQSDDREYTLSLGGYEIDFNVDDGTAHVYNVRRK